jgi:hypothetical protein
LGGGDVVAVQLRGGREGCGEFAKDDASSGGDVCDANVRVVFDGGLDVWVEDVAESLLEGVVLLVESVDASQLGSMEVLSDATFRFQWRPSS